MSDTSSPAFISPATAHGVMVSPGPFPAPETAITVTASPASARHSAVESDNEWNPVGSVPNVQALAAFKSAVLFGIPATLLLEDVRMESSSTDVASIAPSVAQSPAVEIGDRLPAMEEPRPALVRTNRLTIALGL